MSKISLTLKELNQVYLRLTDMQQKEMQFSARFSEFLNSYVMMAYYRYSEFLNS